MRQMKLGFITLLAVILCLLAQTRLGSAQSNSQQEPSYSDSRLRVFAQGGGINQIYDYFSNRRNRYELIDNQSYYGYQNAHIIWSNKFGPSLYGQLADWQMYNHFPGGQTFYNKGSLHECMQFFAEKQGNSARKQQILQSVPETYKVDLLKSYFTLEEERLFAQSGSGHIWIRKPIHGRRGEGIRLFRDLDAFRQEVAGLKPRHDMFVMPGQLDKVSIIVQRYVDQPLLFEGRKIDMRCYLYFASFSPIAAFYHDGYIRTSVSKYSSEDIEDLSLHIMNQQIQKKNEKFQEIGENTLWSIDSFKTQLIEKQGYSQEWVNRLFDGLYKNLVIVIEAVMDKIAHDPLLSQQKHEFHKYFQFFGVDLTLDIYGQTKILELNIDPQIYHSHPEVRPLITKLVTSMLDLQEQVVRNLHRRDDFWLAFKLPPHSTLTPLIVEGQDYYYGRPKTYSRQRVPSSQRLQTTETEHQDLPINDVIQHKSEL